MSETKYTLRQYRDGDEDQIIELLETVFGRFPKIRLGCSKKDHWKWKFKDMPPRLNPTIVAVNKEGNIIGVSHGLIKCTKIGDHEVLARKGSEVAVHPEYRRRGIYSKLVIERERISKEMGAVMSYSLISNPVIVRYKRDKEGKRHEPEFPQPLKFLVKVKDLTKFLDYQERHGGIREGRMIASIGIRILKTVNSMRRVVDHKKKPGTKYTLRKISAFDERVDKLWEMVKDEYDFIVVKSREYLNWRYCDPRGGLYHIWVAEDMDKVLGYMVLRVNEMDPNHPVGYIMEVLTPKNRSDVVDSLLDQAKTFFDDMELNAIYFTVVSRHPYERGMKRHGFIDSMRSPRLFYRPYKHFEGLKRFEGASPDRLHHQFGEYDSL